MILPDVNVLLYAHRREAPEHAAYADWLRAIAQGREPFALSDLVCSAVVRIATNPRAFDPPTSLDDAIDFLERLRRRAHCVTVRPGPGHFDAFVALCREARATGKLVADAVHAAVAVEHGCEWITTDADFARFPSLRWRHPLRSR